jgi:hypothetical protein
LPRIGIGPIDLAKPQRATLDTRLLSPGLILKNSWPLWLFPRVDKEHVNRTVAADRTLLDRLARVAAGVVDAGKEVADEDNTLWVTNEGKTALNWLKAGRMVLFLAKGGALVGSKNPFDPGWFRSDQHMGSVVWRHNLLGDFPHDGFASWQFRYLINRGEDVPEGRTGADAIVSSVFNSTMPHVQHQMFVANTDTGGHLTYCMLKVLTGRCEADYLLWQLLQNAKRDETVREISIERAAEYLGAR